MPKIVKTDDAPEGTVTVNTPDGDELKVGARGVKSDDPAAIDVARQSPYLEVEVDESVLEEFAKANAAYAQGRDPEQIALVKKALDDATDPVVREVAADPDEAFASIQGNTKENKD